MGRTGDVRALLLAGSLALTGAAGLTLVLRGVRASAPTPLAVSVRPLEAPAAAKGRAVTTSPLDRTFVVSVDAEPTLRGAVIVVDPDGRALAKPFLLERSPPTSSSLRAVVPLRALAPALGTARAIVLVGKARCVEGPLPDAVATDRDVRARAERCEGRTAMADLGPLSSEPFDRARADGAAKMLAEGEPAEALATIDRVRGGASGADAALTDAIGAEAAITLGRNVLAGAIARRGLAVTGELSPALRARLLRSSILTQGEATGATPEKIPDRDVLRATEPERTETSETLLDAALDLRLALDHDRVPGPRLVPAAAAHLLEIAREADDETIGTTVMMVCRAARGVSEPAVGGERPLARALRIAERYGSLEDRAYCALTAGDDARDGKREADADALYGRALSLLGEHPLPREQRQTWFSAARFAASRGRLEEASRLAREAYRWVDFSLALQTDLAERDGLLADTFGYYGWAERFAILAGDPLRAIAAAEWGKARTFGALLRDDGEVEDAASGAFVVVRDDEGETRARLESFARSLRPDDAALSLTALGADDAGKLDIAVGIVTRDRTTARLVTRPNGLCPDVRALGAAIAAGEEGKAKEVGRRLYDGIFAPIAADLAGATRLFVSPHLCLQALPWHALYDGERFLAERFAVARVPPLVALDRTARDDEPVFGASSGRAWMLAYDPKHAGDAQLPGLDALAADFAARVHPTIQLSGETLSPERFLSGAARVDALFYAGHARYDAATPLRSSLLVAASPAGVDRVEARAVLGLDHRLDLVFLLGCETSRLLGTALDYSDEAMGLQRAFLAGGARHVLGALWPVLDRDAEDFVRALLEQGADVDVVTAVARAQRCVLERRCAGRGVATWGSFLVDAR